MRRVSHKVTTAVSVGLAALALSWGTAQAEPIHVATTAIVEHPALDAVRDGVKESLKEKGYTGSDFKFTYESAQGNPAIAAQIARRLVGESPKVIVAIATPSAQAVASATKDIPLVFAAITDPRAAKLVDNYAAPGGNITGVSDMPPIDKHLDLIHEFMPNLKKLGVPYNPGEANAVSLVAALKEAGKAKGIEIVEAAAPKSSDVMSAARSLVGKVDAIYAPTDNTIVSALESLVKVGVENKIPVFAGDTASVERGAVAAMGLNYFDLGKQVGDVVARILKGEKPGVIPVTVADNNELFINEKYAASYGIAIPKSVAARATKVIK